MTLAYFASTNVRETPSLYMNLKFVLCLLPLKPEKKKILLLQTRGFIFCFAEPSLLVQQRLEQRHSTHSAHSNSIAVFYQLLWCPWIPPGAGTPKHGQHSWWRVWNTSLMMSNWRRAGWPETEEKGAQGEPSHTPHFLDRRVQPGGRGALVPWDKGQDKREQPWVVLGEI